MAGGIKKPPMGFEPTTSCLPCTHSTSLSYGGAKAKIIVRKAININ